jgi:hypothetical protein
MAVARFAFGKPSANSATLLHTLERTALTSIVAVNLGGTTNISAYVIPAGEGGSPDSWIHYINNVPLKNRDTFETFKLAVNIQDEIYVKSESGDVSFFVNGIYDTTGTTDVTVGAQAPESPQIGSLWINDVLDPQEVFYWTGSAWQTTGIIGPGNILTIGTVDEVGPNGTALVSITGDSPSQTLNFTLKQGPTGPTGPQGTFDVFANAPLAPEEGDVWFNSSDARFYVYYDSYWVEALSNEAGPTGATGVSGADGNFIVSDTEPTSPEEGEAWYNSSTGQMLVYYDGYWVESSSAIVGPTGPTGGLGSSFTTTSGNWASPTPTTIGEALEQLAARVAALE